MMDELSSCAAPPSPLKFALITLTDEMTVKMAFVGRRPEAGDVVEMVCSHGADDRVEILLQVKEK